ncbi:hypothetical protein ACIQLK_14085 [Microbacterium sp. NPDC091382]|uniref:hypothetical protein n=1 Tax=Microbacterium sp. NPDC091382 TaxID=3364210 RepID=UPI0037FACDA1
MLRALAHPAVALTAAALFFFASVHPAEDALDSPAPAPLHTGDADPHAAATWWSGLSSRTQADLIASSPERIGALDGLPADARVAANRVAARDRLRELETTLTTLARRTATPASRTELEPLLQERSYLARVVSGDVKLYLFAPGSGALVEMTGNPTTATGILLVVPGTNASLRSFMVPDPVTAFADWQVDHADPTTPVLAFTVLAAPMPQLSIDLASGPQNNTIATAAGASYARIVKGIDVAFPGMPTLSYEHSAGSQVGSAAEEDGARFDARFLAAGVGATDGYTTSPGTAYYAAQATDDINRLYAGFQVGDIGYGVGPEEFAGIKIIDPGLSDVPPSAPGGMLARGLTLHNRLFSGDATANGTVLTDVRLLLTSLARSRAG